MAMVPVAELFDHDKIMQEVHGLAYSIAEDYKDKEVVFVCVLKGAVPFFVDLCRFSMFKINPIQEFVQMSSYVGTQSTGKLEYKRLFTTDIKDKHVIVVEDIVDSGLTIYELIKRLEREDPASIAICTLLDKSCVKRDVDVQLDYVGFEVEDQFVVGYGMDYNERFRSLSSIYELGEGDGHEW